MATFNTNFIAFKRKKTLILIIKKNKIIFEEAWWTNTTMLEVVPIKIWAWAINGPKQQQPNEQKYRGKLAQGWTFCPMTAMIAVLSSKLSQTQTARQLNIWEQQN